MAIQKNDQTNQISQFLHESVEFTIYIPSTVNVSRRFSAHTVSLETPAMRDMRQSVINEVIRAISLTELGGATIDAEHRGTYFDPQTQTFVPEMGTKISVIVPNGQGKIHYVNAQNKRIETSVSEFFRELALGIKETFNQSSVLITARPIFAAFI